jgi:hypothetical protein
MENNKEFENGLEYLKAHKDEKRCYMCGRKLEEGELYLCIFCQELVERA